MGAEPSAVSSARSTRGCFWAAGLGGHRRGERGPGRGDSAAPLLPSPAPAPPRCGGGGVESSRRPRAPLWGSSLRHTGRTMARRAVLALLLIGLLNALVSAQGERAAGGGRGFPGRPAGARCGRGAGRGCTGHSWSLPAARDAWCPRVANAPRSGRRWASAYFLRGPFWAQSRGQTSALVFQKNPKQTKPPTVKSRGGLEGPVTFAFPTRGANFVPGARLCAPTRAGLPSALLCSGARWVLRATPCVPSRA